MSRYVMKQNWLCWGDDYTVLDDQGRDVLYIDGKVLTLRTTLVVQDMSGNELATIQKKLLSWGPTYEIYRKGTLAAVIKKSLFTLFRCEFTVDVPGPDDDPLQRLRHRLEVDVLVVRSGLGLRRRGEDRLGQVVALIRTR